jgi:hypothetical protein
MPLKAVCLLMHDLTNYLQLFKILIEIHNDKTTANREKNTKVMFQISKAK